MPGSSFAPGFPGRLKTRPVALGHPKKTQALFKALRENRAKRSLLRRATVSVFPPFQIRNSFFYAERSRPGLDRRRPPTVDPYDRPRYRLPYGAVRTVSDLTEGRRSQHRRYPSAARRQRLAGYSPSGANTATRARSVHSPIARSVRAVFSSLRRHGFRPARRSRTRFATASTVPGWRRRKRGPRRMSRACVYTSTSIALFTIAYHRSRPMYSATCRFAESPL